MGYTHYWTPKNFTQKQWDKYTETCIKLKSKLPKDIKIAGGDGTLGKSRPEFNKENVWFNGLGDDSHETFSINGDPKRNAWDFCKTERKPYDLLVVACLIAAWKILGFEFSSDGYNNDGSCEQILQDGIDFYNKVMKPEVPITHTMIKSKD